jgi:hypothetical protein
MEYLVTLPANMKGDFLIPGENPARLNPGINKLGFEKVF